ncbi:acyclic terpene utilization AtuA family protein [Rhodococcus sp. T7]|uniref:acyclic terpene utilization AtuA family protein n=1 Tax=Rhodococcus sp. T7 TaxID=627444 RepID=UPI0013589F89|nr:acyclic terpene utilization AtuA family protein [Rhodococcus sp. T7]KAF0960266.1 hypothetical protein MLGJGCBP_06658 [Rhodococcus sp. T7]
MTARPIRIANFSGYLGDRLSGLTEALTGDPIDVAVGDYLAEITLAALAARSRSGHPGYVDYFLDQIRPHLSLIARTGVKVVTNAGGFDPAALATALRLEADAAGVVLSVAYVEGDNITDELDALQQQGHRFEHLDTGSDLRSWDADILTANAYVGGWGIAAALREGADLVVCGRVTDASLVTGPAAWWHGWEATQWGELAGAVVAGHIIECGPQAVGGNFSGFTEVPGTLRPGFPIAEIAADGSSAITKHAGHDGYVTTDTVTAQLLYEIQGPRYLNPDVTVHLEGVSVQQSEPDRVLVAGAAGSPPPPTTKVAVFGRIGYQVVHSVFVTAPQVDEKVRHLESQLRADLPSDVDLDVTRLGTAAVDPRTQWDATVCVRVMATATAREALLDFNLGRQLRSLYLQSVPGFFHDGASTLVSEPRPRIDYWPALLSAPMVPHAVVLPDGRREAIATSAVTTVPSQLPEQNPPAVPDSGPTRVVELGALVHARSGDKGGNSNVGLWVKDRAHWPWLQGTLTVDELRSLMPEAKDLDIVRHEFAHLGAIHFVLRGLLGTGGSSNLRVDQVGKAVGEYLRAKYVVVPEALFDHTGPSL